MTEDEIIMQRPEPLDSDPQGKFYDTYGKRITVKRQPKLNHYWLACEDNVFHEHEIGAPIITNDGWVNLLHGKDKDEKG